MPYEKTGVELVIDENGGSAFLGIPYASNGIGGTITNSALTLCPVEDILDALSGKSNYNSDFYIFPSEVGFVYIESRSDRNVNAILSKTDLENLKNEYEILSNGDLKNT